MITDRVEECVRDTSSCRGCKYSYNPSLFDGGCILHYEGLDAKERTDRQEAAETAAAAVETA